MQKENLVPWTDKLDIPIEWLQLNVNTNRQSRLLALHIARYLCAITFPVIPDVLKEAMLYADELVDIGKEYKFQDDLWKRTVKFVAKTATAHVNDLNAVELKNNYYASFAVSAAVRNEGETAPVVATFNHWINEGKPKLTIVQVVKPFFPTNTEWGMQYMTTDTTAVARSIYEEYKLDAAPILADALQDAGYENEEIINQLMQYPELTNRGVWILDKLLGKS